MPDRYENVSLNFWNVSTLGKNVSNYQCGSLFAGSEVPVG